MSEHEFREGGSGQGGDAETVEEQSRNSRAALGQDPGSASRDTLNNIFELFCINKVKSLSRVPLFATLWTVAHQAPPPM